jgi:GAF domain-containing protein
VSSHPHISFAQELAGLTRDLTVRSDSDPAGALHELAASAVKSMPGADYAGITMADRHGSVRSVASTHRYPALLDEIQQRYQEGPCLEAAWEHHTITVDDLKREHRWPRYCRDVLDQTPVRSIISFQLFTGRKTVGALSFFADAPRAFDHQSVEMGLMYATHIATAWHTLLRDEQFRRALASRDIIGQAKGIIMERFTVDALQAFELLKRLSQDSNTPIATVAERLVNGEHPHR